MPDTTPEIDEIVALAARERLIRRFSEPTDLADPDIMCQAWRG